MIHLFFIIVGITHILCMAIQIAIQENMILEKLGDWGNKKREQGHKWVEAAFLCPYCAPSIWSSIGYLFAVLLCFITKFEWKLVFMYPLVVGATSLINGLVWSSHELIHKKIKYYENAEKLKYLDIKDRKEAYRKK